MKIYLDLVFFLNFFFDFLLLFATSRLLKEHPAWYRLLLGSFLGAMSIFFLFLKLNSFTLFLLKTGIAFMMIRVTFRFKNIKSFLKQVLYLYLVSIILGGALYFINIQFSYQNSGIIFFHNGLSINFIIILISAPMIIFWYLKEQRHYKNTYQNIYDVKVKTKEDEYLLKGYLDTGNHLKDPYKKRSVLLVEKGRIPIEEKDVIYVPYASLNHQGIVKCKKAEKIEIGSQVYTNMLIGIATDEFKIEDIDCIIPSIVKEDMNG